MSVVHVDLGREMRGGQWQVLSLLKGLQDDSVLLARPGSPLLQRAIEEGLRAEPFGVVSLPLRRALLVHAHDAKSHLWAVMSGCPRIVVSRRVAFPVRESIGSRWKYSRPSAYIAISEFVRDRLREAHVPESKIAVVYDGVDVPEHALPPGEDIVAIESEDPMKGSGLLRDAADMGGFRVRFTRGLDFNGAAVFVYLTHSEGLGSAALHAMAAGVPVVASNVGGLPEIVQHDVTGVLTGNTPQAVVVAIRYALEHRERLAAAARARVLERFTVKRMVHDTREVYRRLLP